ncbi:dihydrofolate reductase [Amphibacillus sp. MSJ-3]|uniref:dihydrofolate reductase n=1 Tax=Amphibacillus sp. MSJ-3 TaxID=2841505 RepID=UPI001C0EA2C6|nr:dihydrofolate reductase [Amphibacillus sp. MSJ-3]MBU5595682.1 dihydrofolate reductase [Amphibacillus sp. MSJ-3]
MLAMIFAHDRNYLIGKDNWMPWSIPNDLAYFKEITSGKTIIMGRKTFESFGKPLPNRHHLILTRNQNYQAEGCEIFHEMQSLLDYIDQRSDEEIIVVGGADIYQLFLPYADHLYITYIDEEFEGDTYLPKIDLTNWNLISKKKGIKNDQNPYDYYFLQYNRK